MGFTREGSLYYARTAPSRDIYTASIDPTTGELLEPPTKAIRQFEGSNLSPAWSPDGKSLAYVSRRHLPEVAGRRQVLVIRSEETGEEREFRPQALLRNLRWSPDGRSILCGRLKLIDVQTGDVTPVVHFGPTDRVRISGTVWSPDGKTIFYIRETLSGQWPRSIMAHDLETGKEKELRQGGISTFGLAVSPDGRQLVFADRSMLKVMPAEGGDPRILLNVHNGSGEVEERDHIEPVTWTADGLYVLFAKGRRQRELWRVPAKGGEPQKLLEMDGLSDISVHPDGRSIAFTGGLRQVEVWAMENFLPESIASR